MDLGHAQASILCGLLLIQDVVIVGAKVCKQKLGLQAFVQRIYHLFPLAVILLICLHHGLGIHMIIQILVLLCRG